MTSLTLIYGMQQINAIATVILLQTEPVYSLILSVVVVGERPSPRQLLATGAILAGIGSVFWAGNAFSPMFAAMLLFITPFFWQTSHVLGLRVMPPLTPISIAGARFIFAACVFIPMFLLRPSASLTQLARPAPADGHPRDRLFRLFPLGADLVWRHQPAFALMDDRAGGPRHPADLDGVRDGLSRRASHLA